MVYDSSKFYVFFVTTDLDYPSSVAEVSKEVFESMNPWAFDLSWGNHEKVPENIEMELFDDNGISDGADGDMRPSELKQFEGKDNVIMVLEN